MIRIQHSHTLQVSFLRNDMSQPALRPWLAVARCSSKPRSQWTRILSRQQSTDQKKRLETPEDWQAFRESRAESSALCSSRPASYLTVPNYLCGP